MICGGGGKIGGGGGGGSARDSLAKKKRHYPYATRDAERPASPSRMGKDILWHVLYEPDTELIRDVTMPAALRVQEYSGGDSELVEFVQQCKNISAMRVLFFIVLSVDSELREAVVCPEKCKLVWTVHGCPAPMCPHKANRFFLDLTTQCIHRWMRNESNGVEFLLDSIRMTYLCS